MAEWIISHPRAASGRVDYHTHPLAASGRVDYHSHVRATCGRVNYHSHPRAASGLPPVIHVRRLAEWIAYSAGVPVVAGSILLQ